MTSHDVKTACGTINSAYSTLRAAGLLGTAGGSSGSERRLRQRFNHAYCNVAARLQSFERWPHIGKLSALAFSNAGFYYAGCGDAVTCFCCGLSLSQWTSGILPATAHSKLSDGRCAFIDETGHRETVAVDDLACGAAGLETAKQQPKSRSVSVKAASLPTVAPVSTVRPATASSASTAAEIIAGVASGEYSKTITRVRVPISALISNASTCNQGRISPITANGSRTTRDDRLNNYEFYRLGTYANRWESTAIVSPQELASAGFYYVGPGDRVQCAFCKGLLRNWEPGDRAMALHAQHFTYCRFVQGHDVGNVPVPFFALKDECAMVLEQSAVDEADASLGISCTLPKHPDFAVESRRQATFLTWPQSTGSLTGEALAKAGFFYLGSEKLVRCFYCDGTVGNWTEDADPWAEHARRYPTCIFVKRVKGLEYVEQVRVSTAESVHDTRSAAFAVDPREIRARVDTPKVRILLRMDYPVDLLREVIQKRLAATGDDHETSEGLLADVFAVHDEKQGSLRLEVVQRQHLREASPVVLVSAAAAAAVDPGDVGARGSTVGTASIALAAANSSSTFEEGAAAASVGRAAAACAGPLAVLPSVSVDRPIDKPAVKASDENLQLKMQLTCKICMDGLVGVVFTPCGHFICCPACAPALTVCPICRVSIRGGGVGTSRGATLLYESVTSALLIFCSSRESRWYACLKYMGRIDVGLLKRRSVIRHAMLTTMAAKVARLSSFDRRGVSRQLTVPSSA